MPTCNDCKAYYPIPKEDMDYEEGVGDCVSQTTDRKGTFWTAKKVKGDMDASKCPGFKKK